MRTVAASLFLVLAATAHAADIWGSSRLDVLCAEFPVVSRDALQLALGGHFDAVVQREGVDPARVHRVDPAGLAPVLQRAAALGVGPLDLFSDPQFAADGPCVLFLDETTLAAVDRQFDIHGLWMVRATVAGEPDAPLAMRYMLLGRGRLIVGYPRHATVQVADYPIFTGRYDYQPYMALDIVATPERRAHVGLRTLHEPSGVFQPFVGPLGAAIREFELGGDGILVRYRVLGGVEREMQVRHPPISLR